MPSADTYWCTNAIAHNCFLAACAHTAVCLQPPHAILPDCLQHPATPPNHHEKTLTTSTLTRTLPPADLLAESACLQTIHLHTQEQYRSAGEEVRRASLQQMKAQLATFKSSLEAFALQHKADIRADPVFRAQFHTMCANIGVDPLASNKVWSELVYGR